MLIYKGKKIKTAVQVPAEEKMKFKKELAIERARIDVLEALLNDTIQTVVDEDTINQMINSSLEPLMIELRERIDESSKAKEYTDKKINDLKGYIERNTTKTTREEHTYTISHVPLYTKITKEKVDPKEYVFKRSPEDIEKMNRHPYYRY